jgi:hypothetical protein
MKFKVGDKVKIIKKSGPGSNYYYGKTAIITETDCESMTGKLGYQIHMLENPDHDSYVWFDDELELIERATFTKADLKDGMVIEYKNGDRRIVLNKCFMNPNGYGSLDYSDFNDDLTLACVTLQKGYDIVKVYSSISTDIHGYCYDSNITLIWERKEEPDYKEMTVAEIEKRLGYKVKIVDGE